MDFEDLRSREAQTIMSELNALICRLRDRGLKISSWWGYLNSDPLEQINRGYHYKKLEDAADDKNFPWFLYWEIVWVVLNNDFVPGQKLLDLGGSSSLFSYYLASKGIHVTTVDIRGKLIENANFVAKQMGWPLKNYVMDMRKMSFAEKFDHITSICVYEHIPMYDRVTINQEIKKLLAGRGKFSLTFDYRNPSRLAQIDSPKSVYEQFVKPSGLKTRGNADFFDNGKNYLLNPFYFRKRLWFYKLCAIARGHFSLSEFHKTKEADDYTFGALFMEK